MPMKAAGHLLSPRLLTRISEAANQVNAVRETNGRGRWSHATSRHNARSQKWTRPIA